MPEDTQQLKRFSAGKAPPNITCIHCEEPITASDAGFVVPCMGGDEPVIHFHHACFLRGIIGSIGHQQQRCSCWGGDEEDPPELTKRQAAELAVKYWHARQN